MSTEYPTSQEQAHEAKVWTSHPEKTAQVTPQEESQAPKDAHEQIQDVAIQIGEDPATLVKRRDVASVLERMKEGLTITVHVSRPRFWSKLTLDDLGLAAGKTLATSEAANKVLNDYFRLGRRSFLPKEYQDKLNLVETSARQCIARYAFKSHWGAFVPLTLYPEWKKANAEVEKEFWKVRDEIVANYEAITEQVMDAFRPLAEDAWRRVTLGKALFHQQADASTHEVIEQIVISLKAEEGKESFVNNYLAYIRSAMPHPWEIEDGFTYEVERAVIPLPSLLARDMEQADRMYQERALKDAKTRAELEAIEIQRRAEMEKLSQQQQQERERHYQQLRAEQQRQQLQLEMERDILDDARRQKERLVQEFYTEVMHRISTLTHTVTGNILNSLDEHGGILRGRVSVQLSHLIKQLEQLNFVEDAQIESQLNRLRDVLPTDDEKEKAAKGLARINTTRIGAVVRKINEEAEHILVELGAQPQPRKQRKHPLTAQAPLDLDTRRKVRAGAALALQQDEQEAASPQNTTPKRRGQKRT